MITRSITEPSGKLDKQAHLAKRKRAICTCGKILSDVDLQSLSYLEEVLNLGTSE